MKREPFRMLRILAAATVLAGVCAAPAWSSMPLRAQVSGQVTAVNGTVAVTINGQTYLINRNSPAYQGIQGVRVGDRIGLVLDGPAGVSGTQVIGILPGSGSKPSSR